MNLNQLASWFSYLSIYSVLLPLFYYFKNKENFKSKSLNILAALLIMGWLTDLIADLITLQFHLPNLPLINIEFVLEFILISWLFFNLCPPIKAVLKYIIPLFLAVFIITLIYWQDIYTYQSITRITAAIIILVYVARYYSYLLQNKPKIPIDYFPPFWISLAFYSYYIVNLFVYALSNYFFYNQPGDIGQLFWMTHSFIEIVKNILLAVAFYIATRTQPDIIETYIKKNAVS